MKNLAEISALNEKLQHENDKLKAASSAAPAGNPQAAKELELTTAQLKKLHIQSVHTLCDGCVGDV